MYRLGIKIIKFSVKHANAAIIGAVIAACALGFLLPRIKLDNSVDVFFDKDSKSGS